MAADQDQKPCPICRDTGVAHRAPYMVGTRHGDLYTITMCSCDAAREAMADHIVKTGAEPPEARDG